MAHFDSVSDALMVASKWKGEGALFFCRSKGGVDVYCRKILYSNEMNDEQLQAFQQFIDAFGSISMEVRARIKNHKLVPDKVEMFLP